MHAADPLRERRPIVTDPPCFHFPLLPPPRPNSLCRLHWQHTNTEPISVCPMRCAPLDTSISSLLSLPFSLFIGGIDSRERRMIQRRFQDGNAEERFCAAEREGLSYGRLKFWNALRSSEIIPFMQNNLEQAFAFDFWVNSEPTFSLAKVCLRFKLWVMMKIR